MSKHIDVTGGHPSLWENKKEARAIEDDFEQATEYLKDAWSSMTSEQKATFMTTIDKWEFEHKTPEENALFMLAIMGYKVLIYLAYNNGLFILEE